MESTRTIHSDQADLREGLDAVSVDMQVAAGSIEDLRLEALKSVAEITFLREETGHRLTLLEEMLERLQKGFDELQAKAAPTPTQDNPGK